MSRRELWPRRELWIAASLAVAALAFAPPARAADAAAAIARGDAAWERRADGAQGGRAARAPIAGAVAAYEEAVKAAPANLEASWKLLRALWFEGEYVATSQEEKQRVFGRGKSVSENAWAAVRKRANAKQLDSERAAERAAALRGIPEAPPLLLWSAADWGLWGNAFGKLAAARQGVGEKVRDWAETLIALDDRFQGGAGHRVLGRLHAEAPKIPFFTGWVDHDKAIAELEKALAIAPDELSNRFYLAEALLVHRPAAKARAVALLREVAKAKARPSAQVEDTALSSDATRRLAALE
jgi:tetratricopeptide (TPR) repeat protein